MPSRRLFITFEIVKTNDIDFHIIQDIDDPRGPALIKFTPEIDVAISIRTGGIPIRMI